MVNKSMQFHNFVLNLIITGIPSILDEDGNIYRKGSDVVLNLIITGIPSIHS